MILIVFCNSCKADPLPLRPARIAAAPVINAINWRRIGANQNEGSLEKVNALPFASEINRDTQKINPRESCSVCLEPMLDTVLKCGHAIQLQCVWEWRKRSSLCPLCRTDAGREVTVLCQQCNISRFTWPIFRIGEIVEAKERAACPECIC